MDLTEATRPSVRAALAARIPTAAALARLATTCALVVASGCAAGDPSPTAGTGAAAYTVSHTTVGDWSSLPDGEECLPAMQAFYPAKFGVRLPIAPNAWTGDCGPEGACHLWLDTIPSASQWDRIPNDGTSLPSTYDLMVYPPTSGNIYGHVAAVDHVEGSEIYVMDDNYVCHHCRSSAPHTVGGAAYGWYHLRSAGTSPPPAPAPAPSSGASCAGLNDGLYCGNDAVNGDANTLYQCRGGSISVFDTCANGCQTNPAGTNDACVTSSAPPPSPPPSGPSCAGLNDGLYCGSDAVNGDANTLYLCSGGSISVEDHCANGCQTNPAGTNDACIASAPPPPPPPSGPSCAGLNDGLYCGSDAVNGDANTLYLCSGGSISVFDACANGCQTNPAGTNDACIAAAPPPSSGPSCDGLNDGYYCGSDYVNGDPNTLYGCNGGTIYVVQYCSNGCQTNPDGTNDACN